MRFFGIAALLSSLAALLLPTAHAKDNAARLAPAQVASVGAPARGALYRVQHHGRTSYLFGTIHVGTPDFALLGVEVAQALAQSGKLVLELDVRNDALLQVALQKHGLYSDGAGIEGHVAADTLALLKKALDGFDIPLANVRHMKPWLLANLLMGLDLDRNGFRRQHGAEYVLLAAAPGKQVMPLETAEYQMSLFDSMAAALQEEYLRETLAELGDGNAMKKARALIDAWANADRDKLDQLWQESRTDPSRSSEFTHRVLLDQRNPEMANKVESLLREDDSSFVGVGLLHLIGDTGLPALLRARGYLVEKMY
jgi:uncharacterized protein